MTDELAPSVPARYVVAVRTLCEFTARTGDIDVRFAITPSAQEGTAGHAAVTARRSPGYLREVSLRGTYEGLEVRGRADGFDVEAQVLEEIKTHRGDLARQPPSQRAVHWAQARIYGWLLCESRGLAALTIRLVYYDLDAARETWFDETLSADALQAFFVAQCARFTAWADAEKVHRSARDTALAALGFPHAAFRPGQRALAAAVYRCARDGGVTAIEAPTGIGKTLGTLFPMLRAMPVRPLDKVVFLAARTPGRGLALQALRTLDTAGARPLRVLELVARDKACEHPGSACTGATCPLARGFYDRLPEARAAAAQAGWLDRAALKAVAAHHAVCPYYLGQEMMRWADVIIGDYNYVFDTRAAVFSLAQAQGDALGVLVDEAHNLVERGRSMYTSALGREALAQARLEAPALASVWRRLGAAWRGLATRHAAPYTAADKLDADFVAALTQSVAPLAEFLAGPSGASATAVQQLYFDLLHFLRLAERFGDHSLFEVTQPPAPASRPRTGAAIRCVVPAPHLASRWAGVSAAVLFSGTFSPADFYADMLGLPANTQRLSVPTPFSAEQLEVRIARHVSTRYADRDRSLAPITDILAAQFAARPGNYLAFFGSFAYLESVLTHVVAQHPDVPVWSQTPGMDEAARDAFLARFVAGGQGIGFAVLGGAFAEGVDLPGERLIGAFVATLGLPQVNAANEALKARLQSAFGTSRGYDYAYLYPGLRKVVQAAGRVIRTPTDRGVLHLIDDRFARPAVGALLPSWWDQNVVQSSSSTVLTGSRAGRAEARGAGASADAG